MRFIAEENITAEGSRVFGEITSSTWFQLVSEETKQSDWDRYWFRFFDFVIELFFCAGYQLPIVVIPYSDSTQVISWKRRTEHPIYVTLGNLPLQERESQSGKRLWGFIPDIDSLDFPEMRDDEIATLRRWVMAQSLQHLFARIKENRKLKWWVEDLVVYLWLAHLNSQDVCYSAFWQNLVSGTCPWSVFGRQRGSKQSCLHPKRKVSFLRKSTSAHISRNTGSKTRLQSTCTWQESNWNRSNRQQTSELSVFWPCTKSATGYSSSSAFRSCSPYLWRCYLPSYYSLSLSREWCIVYTQPKGAWYVRAYCFFLLVKRPEGSLLPKIRLVILYIMFK